MTEYVFWNIRTEEMCHVKAHSLEEARNQLPNKQSDWLQIVDDTYE
jgi:hypothetical protein